MEIFNPFQKEKGEVIDVYPQMMSIISNLRTDESSLADLPESIENITEIVDKIEVFTLNRDVLLPF